MKVVILAGGYGTRISEESVHKPKPMIEIGGYPVLWHIMKIYSYYGFNDFIICSGYKEHIIKRYFLDYHINNSNITFDFSNNTKYIHPSDVEPWKVSIINTGLDTMTGGRVKKIKDFVGDERFMLTYGDGLSDINIKELIENHRKNNKIATITAVKQEPRFGILNINDNKVTSFREKDNLDTSWINGGYMVFEPEIFDFIQGDDCVLEDILDILCKKNMLNAYKHTGFWKCMDTVRDKQELELLIKQNNARWKVW